MSQNAKNKNIGGGTGMKKFNYTKWGLIIAIAGVIITALTVPEFRGVIGLKSETPKSESPVVSKADVELITQTDTGEALDGVEIQFISQGAPEVQYTDSNGYAKVQIPSKGDVVVNLSKKGYPSQNFMINLENDQTRTRIVRFNQSGVPEVQPLASASPATPVPSPSPTIPPADTNSAPTASSHDLSLNNQPSVLVKQECLSATPGYNLNYILRRPTKESVPLGREVLPLLAFMQSDEYYVSIPANKPVELACNLKSSFKELKLVFGVHGANSYARPENKLVFGVFLDNKPAGTKQVVVGEKQEWTLPLQGVKNVSLRAECTTDSCPALSFAEMSLK
jgi:hypothetical protein